MPIIISVSTKNKTQRVLIKQQVLIVTNSTDQDTKSISITFSYHKNKKKLLDNNVREDKKMVKKTEKRISLK